IEEIPTFTRKIKFWSVIRELENRYINGIEKLKNLTGLETITDVISSAEKDIFDFIPDLLNQDEIVSLPNYALEYIEFVANNPNTMPGLPTGFPRWDSCLGGGLRRGTVNMIAA